MNASIPTSEETKYVNLANYKAVCGNWNRSLLLESRHLSTVLIPPRGTVSLLYSHRHLHPSSQVLPKSHVHWRLCSLSSWSPGNGGKGRIHKGSETLFMGSYPIGHRPFSQPLHLRALWTAVVLLIAVADSSLPPLVPYSLHFLFKLFGFCCCWYLFY